MGIRIKSIDHSDYVSVHLEDGVCFGEERDSVRQRGGIVEARRILVLEDGMSQFPDE